MVQVYADLVEAGIRTIEQVPYRIRRQVIEELERRERGTILSYPKAVFMNNGGN